MKVNSVITDVLDVLSKLILYGGLGYFLYKEIITIDTFLLANLIMFSKEKK